MDDIRVDDIRVDDIRKDVLSWSTLSRAIRTAAERPLHFGCYPAWYDYLGNKPFFFSGADAGFTGTACAGADLAGTAGVTTAAFGIA